MPAGGGNTVGLMRALVEAGAQAVLVGVVTDAALAQEAHRLGVGAAFEARFNRAGAGDPFALPYTRSARVLALSDGRFVGRRGLVSGSQRDMGPSALLDLGGVRVAVISHRQQLLDPAGAEDHRRHVRVAQAPRDGQRRRRKAQFGGFLVEE